MQSIKNIYVFTMQTFKELYLVYRTFWDRTDFKNNKIIDKANYRHSSHTGISAHRAHN